MANAEHLKLLKRSVREWNNWRIENKDESPKLSEADLSWANLLQANLAGADLSGANLLGASLSKADLSGANLSLAKLIGANLLSANLSRANLSGAKLIGTNLLMTSLSEADFSRADLSEAYLSEARLSKASLLDANLLRANLTWADLSRANFSNTNLSEADLSWANLSGAKLIGTNLLKANLTGANLSWAKLSRADLSKVILAYTIFGNTDLSKVKGLETIQHRGPSTLGVDTIYISKEKLPEVFLRGCGVPEELITYLPSLLGAAQAIQFYSCFISYSTQDEEFAKRLHSKMREAQLRVWFAPEDIKGGKKIFDQIDTAIQMHDRLLLVLSEHSMKSEWVFTEIRRTLKAEKKEGRRKLFPIRLVDYEKIKEWELIDADTGKDLALEIRSYFIPNFANWKDHDNFEVAFDKLLRDLKAQEE